MRVHELAKAAGLQSKDILAIAKKHRLPIKQSASATIDDKDVRKLWPLIKKFKAELKAQEEEEKRRLEEERQRKEEERRRQLEEKRRALEEERRRKEEEERKRREEEERQRREEEERRRREEEEQRRKEKEEEERRRKEEEERQRQQHAQHRPQQHARPTAPPAAAAPQIGHPRPAPQRDDHARRPQHRHERGPKQPAPTAEVTNLEPEQVKNLLRVMPTTTPPRRSDKSARQGKTPDRKRSDKPRPTKIFELEEEITTTRPATKRGGVRTGQQSTSAGAAEKAAEPPQPKTKKLVVRGPLPVKEFAEKLGVPLPEVMRKIISLGERLIATQDMTQELMELVATDFGVELEFELDTDEYDIAKFLPQEKPENMRRRPPVVTIMGHVDHGKTTLLDRIRHSNIAEGEYGGITQHIGAYHVTTPRGDIVFIDTPGHEAFTAMRARGASVTDIVVLVVAADDGFKDQTIEAINHARAAQVPIIVAVNKIDVPGADPQRIRQEALQYSLVPEELGGDTIFVDISAKFSKGIDKLLEMLTLQAEIMDLKADPTCNAVGTVVESHVNKKRGTVATVLVQKGTLRVGDALVVGDISGGVRAMWDDHGRRIKEAGPSFPAEILGLDESPAAGETFVVVPNERIAREIAEKRRQRRRKEGETGAIKHLSLERLHELISEGKAQVLPIILKTDVQGTLEAVADALRQRSSNEIQVRIVHSEVGTITENDVNLADASDAIIIGFNVTPDPKAKELAAQAGVEIRCYRTIYELLDEVEKAMLGMLEPTYDEKVVGHAEVRKLYEISGSGTVAGCYVTDGEILRDAKVRVLRNGDIVHEGSLSSLKHYKDDVKSVRAGQECGIAVEKFDNFEPGDIIEAYRLVERTPTLTRTESEAKE
jgi:translation initiation factor IF-2